MTLLMVRAVVSKSLPILWRISKHVDLSGRGGLLTDNRWNTKGRPMVYLAESVPGAILEVVVHLLENTVLPDGLKLIRIDYPAAIECEAIQEADLADGWAANLASTWNWGDSWALRCKTAFSACYSAKYPKFLARPGASRRSTRKDRSTV